MKIVVVFVLLLTGCRVVTTEQFPLLTPGGVLLIEKTKEVRYLPCLPKTKSKQIVPSPTKQPTKKQTKDKLFV